MFRNNDVEFYHHQVDNPGPYFFRLFKSYLKFAIAFLIFFIILAIMIWHLQPWYQVKFVAANEKKHLEQTLK